MANAPTKVPAQKGQAGTSIQKEQTGTSVWSPFDVFQRQVDRVFDDFGRGFGFPMMRNWMRPDLGLAHMTVPAVDITAKDGAYEISAELPGMDENDIELSLANGILTIRGQKSEHKEDTRKDYRLSERRFGAFERAFSLPEDADTEKIGATFKKGVLTIALPKRPEAAKVAKKVPIKAG